MHKQMLFDQKHIWESYKTMSSNTRKNTCMCLILGNLKEKCVENYGDLTLLDLSMHCKNLNELSIAKMMMSCGSLSHISPFFTIENVCIGLTKLASRKARDLQCIKA